MGSWGWGETWRREKTGMTPGSGCCLTDATNTGGVSEMPTCNHGLEMLRPYRTLGQGHSSGNPAWTLSSRPSVMEAGSGTCLSGYIQRQHTWTQRELGHLPAAPLRDQEEASLHPHSAATLGPLLQGLWGFSGLPTGPRGCVGGPLQPALLAGTAASLDRPSLEAEHGFCAVPGGLPPGGRELSLRWLT